VAHPDQFRNCERIVMHASAPELARVFVIGVGATAAMDAWLLFLQRIGVPSMSFAYVGRWVGHLARGTWAHASIAKAAPVRGELALGWLAHYAIGIAFAALMVAAGGDGWAESPTLLPALLVGVATAAAPLLVLQPAMGAGVASSKTATPVRNTIKSLATHVVFGLGLYLAAILARLAATSAATATISGA
jgi:hypothetical protein